MARIRLGEEDGKRYDRIDWLPFDGNRLSIDEAIFLEETLGIAYERFQHMLAGELMLDERGAPVLRNNKPVRRIVPRTWKIVVLLALRRSGVDVAFDDLVFDIHALEAEADDTEGKDPADPESET